VVILGAGLDTRPYRLAGMGRVQVFELDLSEEAVRRALAFVGTSAPGSILVFTYVLKSMIERHSDLPGAEKLLEVVAKRGSPWLFGLDPPSVASYLAPFHLHLRADVGNAEYQARYLEPLGRKLVVSECERIAQAAVMCP
jgi:O-methyltransferase involved in polyketide biosynthesis